MAQSVMWRSLDAWTAAIAIVMGMVAFLSIAFGGSPMAAVMALFVGSFLTGFVRPKRAWAWALAIWILTTIGAVIDVTKNPNPGPFAWCPAPHPPTSALSVGGVLLALALVGAYLGVAADWVVSLVARLAVRFKVPLVEYLKPGLRLIAVAAVAVVVAGVALQLAEPLQPLGINEPYCWDEFCFAVTAVDRKKTVGEGTNRVSARGTYYVVTARMETPWWGRFRWGNRAVYVLDYSGNTYEFDERSQRALGGVASSRALCHEIPGAAEREVIVFDLPDAVVQPRLIARDAQGLEGIVGRTRLLEPYTNAAFNLRYDL